MLEGRTKADPETKGPTAASELGRLATRIAGRRGRVPSSAAPATDGRLR